MCLLNSLFGKRDGGGEEKTSQQEADARSFTLSLGLVSLGCRRQAELNMWCICHLSPTRTKWPQTNRHIRTVGRDTEVGESPDVVSKL